MRDGQLAFHNKTGHLQPGPNGPWVKIKIKWGKLDGLWRKRIPGLPAQRIAQDRFIVLLIRKFQDESGVYSQGGMDFAQRPTRIDHMMQGADHGGDIKKAWHK